MAGAGRGQRGNVAARLATVSMHIRQAFNVPGSAGHLGRAPVPRNARYMRLLKAVKVPVEGGRSAHV